MPQARRDVLLRVANVNPGSVATHSDRALYSAIGVFILLYFGYATAGGAEFVDVSSGNAHPWYRFIVGPLLAAGVVAYDRAVVGRVAISYDELASADPRHLLKPPTAVLYVGRLGLAVLCALIITEPLMLARYSGEIDARLNDVHNQQLGAVDRTGAIATLNAQLGQLKQQDATDDAAVATLTGQAAQKRADALVVYQQALADSDGKGVTHKGGCPTGGYCYNLVQRSRELDDAAAGLDRQAQSLQASQQGGRALRGGEQGSLLRQLDSQRSVDEAAIRGDAGFGARTAAMWYLVRADFWGVGAFYIAIMLLLVALDCAAVGLKFVSRGNAYERSEARIGRLREHEAQLAHEREVHDARTYGEAVAKVVEHGIEAAAGDEQVAKASAARACAVLRDSVIHATDIHASELPGEAHNGRPHRPLHAELILGDEEEIRQAARNQRQRRPLRTPVILPEDHSAL